MSTFLVYIQNTYTAYHATDVSNVSNIIKNNFTFKSNDTHWLGDGIYFFCDITLARNWAKKPSKKYGKIINPVIIKVKIEVDENYTCDMRNLDSFNNVKKQFDLYWERLNELGIIIKNASYKKIRCTFFNWLINETQAKCIIAYFSERKNSLPTQSVYEKIFYQFKIPYDEVQMCITDKKCIVKRQIIK